jgi:hypothetical protein
MQGVRKFEGWGDREISSDMSAKMYDRREEKREKKKRNHKGKI